MTTPARPTRHTFDTRAHAPEHGDDPEYATLVALEAAKLDLLGEITSAYVVVKTRADELVRMLERGEKPMVNDPFPQTVAGTRAYCQKRLDVLRTALDAAEELVAREHAQYEELVAELFPPPAPARAARKPAPVPS